MICFFYVFFPLKKRGGGQCEVGAFARGLLAIPLGLSPNSALSFFARLFVRCSTVLHCTALYCTTSTVTLDRKEAFPSSSRISVWRIYGVGARPPPPPPPAPRVRFMGGSEGEVGL